MKYCQECGNKLEDKDMHIVFILDESGSMGSIWDSTIDAVNEYFNAQKLEEGKTWVTLVKFDTEFRPLYNFMPLKDIKPLTRETYCPRGMTALHDAIGRTIDEHKNRKNIKTIFVVMTDGGENSSKQHTLDSVKTRIEKQKKDGWDFVFLGANIDSYNVGGNYGFNTTVNWKATDRGVVAMASSMQNYSTVYRATGQSIGSAALQEDVDSGSN